MGHCALGPGARAIVTKSWCTVRVRSRVGLQNCLFSEFYNTRIWNYGISKTNNFEGRFCVPLLPSKWSLFGVPEFQNYGFWNSGTPEMDHFEVLLCFPRLPSKCYIWGVQEFKNSRIEELLNSCQEFKVENQVQFLKFQEVNKK